MPTPPRNPGPGDSLPAADPAGADCDAALAGKVCTQCGRPAVSAVTPKGSPSFARLRAGERRASRRSVLAATTDWRCERHTSASGRRPGDGLTAAQRAAVDCDAVLVAKTCSRCGRPATTGLTPPGFASFSTLRSGHQPSTRAAALAGITDWRCRTHPPAGRPRRNPAPPPRAASPARRAETAGPALGTVPDPDVVGCGGPVALTRALARARTMAQLLATVDAPREQVARAYTALGVDVARVLGHRRGTLRSAAVDAHGGAGGLLAELAVASTPTALARRLGRPTPQARSVYEELGVALPVWFAHRLAS